MAKFKRQELYAVYLSISDWLRVMECLFNSPEYAGLAEYIGDEMGTMIATHPRSFEACHSCHDCMYRDNCIVRATPPICEHYLNVKAVM